MEKKRSKVLLGMSGGVDSSVAAALLVEQGYDVHGITLQIWENEDETSSTKPWQERGCCKLGMARHVARLLNIPHDVIPSRAAFQSGVIDDFVSNYLAGSTPNPCVRCNERVKFEALYRLADQFRADYIATGHYAKIDQKANGSWSLFRATDLRKDQTYFLYRLNPDWLPRILFPLGDLHKAEVWQRAEALGLPAEELQESQEICFVNQGDYRTFLKAHAPQAVRPGPMIDHTGRYLGQHEGIAFYTPGQRRGLGLSIGTRLYVHRVIPETNTVVLGPSQGLESPACIITDLRLFEPNHFITDTTIDVKIRYAARSVPATFIWQSEKTALLRFRQPQRAVSPGQSAVFYRGDEVLGGGIILRAEPLPENHASAFQHTSPNADSSPA
ncbi:MAG: tRNA 2-thiouridine(34) synthase MnmA [Nitrospirae bacterium]|nr:MAG: tRNA 2-thiouridine(34) synthase MnmA [Nitrospirota bacterium]